MPENSSTDLDLAGMRSDRDRLDWLDGQTEGVTFSRHPINLVRLRTVVEHDPKVVLRDFYSDNARSAIDEARKYKGNMESSEQQSRSRLVRVDRENYQLAPTN